MKITATAEESESDEESNVQFIQGDEEQEEDLDKVAAVPGKDKTKAGEDLESL